MIKRIMEKADIISRAYPNVFRLLYLTMDDIKSLGFRSEDFINFVERVLVGQSQCKGESATCASLQLTEGLYTTVKLKTVSMEEILGVQLATIRWDKDESKKGYNNHFELIVLFDTNLGIPLAVMDGKYVAGKCRSGAVGVCIRWYARPDARTAGIVGLIRESYDYAITSKIALPTLNTVRVYDPQNEEKTFESCWDFLQGEVFVTNNIEEILYDSDIVILSPPYHNTIYNLLQADWLTREGLLVITFDKLFLSKYKNLVRKIAIDAAEQDFLAEIETPIILHGDVISGKSPARKSKNETIIAVNDELGLQLHLCKTIYLLATEKGIGTWLDAVSW